MEAEGSNQQPAEAPSRELEKRKRQSEEPRLGIGGAAIGSLIDDLHQRLLKVDPTGADEAVAAYRAQIAAQTASNRALVGKWDLFSEMDGGKKLGWVTLDEQFCLTDFCMSGPGVHPRSGCCGPKTQLRAENSVRSCWVGRWGFTGVLQGLSDELELEPEELDLDVELFLTYITHHRLDVFGLEINGHRCRPEFDGKLQISAEEDSDGALGGSFACEFEGDMFEEDYKIDVEFWGRRAHVQPAPRPQKSKQPGWFAEPRTELSAEECEMLAQGRERHLQEQALLKSMYDGGSDY